MTLRDFLNGLLDLPLWQALLTLYVAYVVVGIAFHIGGRLIDDWFSARREGAP